MKFPLNFNNSFKKENLTEGLQNFREERENRKTVKRNFKENIPLNFRERSNARASLLASVIVLAVLVILFNQLDYRMIRKPAIDAQKKSAAAKEKPETTLPAMSQLHLLLQWATTFIIRA